jgi:hypothetical protein
LVLFLTALLFTSQLAFAQFAQQGPKLVGTGAVGLYQGQSVALSADGNTAIVGGWGDHSDIGAAWVFTRSRGVWTQQGDKLVGTDAVGQAAQGYSVGLSSDGNTAIVGGPGDSGMGAAWVYIRSNGVWTQQGSKLVGTGASGDAGQGSSVALSADGNTAIIGGPNDKVDRDCNTIGAAWVFTRSGGVWTQQGDKLVGSGASGPVSQGSSVALSADGSTAIVGGFFGVPDDSAWVFTRSGGVWTQQGSKLVVIGAVGSAQQGSSVALSGDGNTAIVGGPNDNVVDSSGNSIGAAWVFTRSGGVWTQQGSKLVGTGAVGSAQQGSSVALSGDGNTASSGGLPITHKALMIRRSPAAARHTSSGRRGSLPAATVCGPSRAANWSAPARLEGRTKAGLSRSPPTATPPSWAGLATIRPSGPRGSLSSRRWNSPPPPTSSAQAIQAAPSLPHHSNIN